MNVDCSYYPNPDIETRIRVQSISTYSELIKFVATSLVIRYFLRLLGMLRGCDISVFSLSGFGLLNNKKEDPLNCFLNFYNIVGENRTKITTQAGGVRTLVRLLNNGTKVPAPNGYLMGIINTAGVLGTCPSIFST